MDSVAAAKLYNDWTIIAGSADDDSYIKALASQDCLFSVLGALSLTDIILEGNQTSLGPLVKVTHVAQLTGDFYLARDQITTDTDSNGNCNNGHQLDNVQSCTQAAAVMGVNFGGTLNSSNFRKVQNAKKIGSRRQYDIRCAGMHI